MLTGIEESLTKQVKRVKSRDHGVNKTSSLSFKSSLAKEDPKQVRESPYGIHFDNKSRQQLSL